MGTKEIIFIGIIAIAVAVLYILKYRFKKESRIRYLEIYKQGEYFRSYDAFWKVKYLKKKSKKFRFYYPTVWTFVPLCANRTKLLGMKIKAKGRFKSKYLVLKSDKPIKSINMVNPHYHISVYLHFNVREDSRKIADSIDIVNNSAVLEYAKNYLIVFEDDTGCVMKIRK